MFRCFGWVGDSGKAHRNDSFLTYGNLRLPRENSDSVILKIVDHHTRHVRAAHGAEHGIPVMAVENHLRHAIYENRFHLHQLHHACLSKAYVDAQLLLLNCFMGSQKADVDERDGAVHWVAILSQISFGFNVAALQVLYPGPC